MKTSNLLIVLLVALVAHCERGCCKKTITRNPELKANYVEGDLKLTDEQKRMLFESLVKRSGIISKRYRWPGSVVYFKFAGDIGLYILFVSCILWFL